MSTSEHHHPTPARYHFAGIAGSGMSALAQFHRQRGGIATGSDRSFDPAAPDPAAREIRRQLERAGVRIFPQDGSGLDTSPPPDALVVSTAVEERVPDVRAARARGIPLLHRSELLAALVAGHRTIAVTGTSGKSTVTAMIFELLQHAGLDASVITGGDLLCLRRRDLLGNAWAGQSDLLVIEADESDGSLVRYEPWMGVLLNLQRDHKEPEELAAIFETFRRRCRGPFILGEEANLTRFAASPDGDPARAAIRFGFDESCDLRAIELELHAERTRCRLLRRDPREEAVCELPLPGRHNVANALAALAAVTAAGLSLEQGVAGLAGFAGVARRFQSLGRARGVEVIDDFAHNPEKIRAALAAGHLRARRVIAFFQPHGYGPTRFLRDGLIEAFAAGLTGDDHLFLPEIYYAGGTATRDVSAEEIVREVAARGVPADFAPRREDLLDPMANAARPGDLILVMGARDPSLTEFGRGLLRRLEETA